MIARSCRIPADTVRVARTLAAQLAAGRMRLAVMQPRICCDCHCVYTVSAPSSPLRCWRCGIERGERLAEPVPTDAPGDDCPEHGPYTGETCPKESRHV